MTIAEFIRDVDGQQTRDCDKHTVEKPMRRLRSASQPRCAPCGFRRGPNDTEDKPNGYKTEDRNAYPVMGYTVCEIGR
jgi:hypothetical protein